ncbi:ATP-binding protein [Flavobacterium sp.]|jgi:hypothetical protein|uniref:ATP-binding protein n=1 Tax=Flavobacterium sp. TaxID=239 RepID=UPI0037C05101
MNFQLGPEIITSYKRLSYTAWYALAEFIDNSTQSYFNNESILEPVLRIEGKNLTVKITFATDLNGDYILIEDNSIGMSAEELEDAVIVGKPPKNQGGRSKYGIGMKTAACWFGDMWTVRTKKLGEEFEESITINVDEIASSHLDLNHQRISKPLGEHYTTIEIRHLNRKIIKRTAGRVKTYLSSMYRRDFNNYNFELYFQGNKLEWDYDLIQNRLLLTPEGERVLHSFNFEIGDKTVKGWAGVMEKGSRMDAGFTILQSDRVIIGFPDSYRPETLFGGQEGGSNDLVNQRLVGEIELDGFEVSHTKDEILYEDQDKDELEAKLFDELADYKRLALSYRKYQSDERSTKDDDSMIALNEFESEIISDEFDDLITNYDVPSDDLLKDSNIAVLQSVTKKVEPSLKAKIKDLTIYIYLSDGMSPNDPYVIIDSIRTKESVYILINKNHPHWMQLKNKESILNFIRHCVYDAVAEWKTYFKIGKIEPDTIKDFKDKLLRIPFEIEKHSI